MKKLTVIIVIAVVFFIIGMVYGNYRCGMHFCNAVTSIVELASDLVKTEVKGITTVVGAISGLVG